MINSHSIPTFNPIWQKAQQSNCHIGLIYTSAGANLAFSLTNAVYLFSYICYMESSGIIISSRHCGPIESGNGGYVSGIVAKQLCGTIQVRLYLPPPLNKQLSLQSENKEECVIYDKDQLVAKGVKVADSQIAELLMDSMPTPPTFPDATKISKRFAGHDHHSFPNCYVCGTARSENEGLRVFTGVNDDNTYVAGPFNHFDSLFSSDGFLKTEECWAALDCPGAWAAIELIAKKKLVLGTITAKILKPIKKTDKIIAMAWPLGAEGRKHFVGTALVDGHGVTRAWAHSIWIEIK